MEIKVNRDTPAPIKNINITLTPKEAKILYELLNSPFVIGIDSKGGFRGSLYLAPLYELLRSIRAELL